MIPAYDSSVEDSAKGVSYNKKLRILIDARKLYHGGIGVYIQNLVSGLLKTNEASLSIIVQPGENIPREWLSEVKIITDHAKPYSFDEMWNLAKRIDFSEIDLFHVPHYTLPYHVPVPTVVTVHDLIHINHPEKKYYPWIAAPLIRSALKRADRILTVSKASENDINKLVRSSSKITSKIRIIPNAVDEFYIRRSLNSADVPPAKKLNGKYLLSVFSNIKPHKAPKDLIRAYALAQQTISKDIKLYLVGQGTENIVNDPEFLDLSSKTKGVNIIGPVSREELAELYLNAEALVVPSLAEGFYIPAIEAQAMGTPVITRPVPSVLELVTGSDFVAKDFSVKALAEKIVEFAEKSSEPARDNLSAEHLKKFDQFNLARTVLEVYKETYQAKKADK